MFSSQLLVPCNFPFHISLAAILSEEFQSLQLQARSVSLNSQQPCCLLEPCSAQHTAAATHTHTSIHQLFGGYCCSVYVYVVSIYFKLLHPLPLTLMSSLTVSFLLPCFIPLLFLLLPSGALLTLIDYTSKVRSCSIKASLLCYIPDFGAGLADYSSYVKPFILTCY